MHICGHVKKYINLNPPRINMSNEKGPFEKEMASSNHYCSGDMLVFGGVTPFDPRMRCETTYYLLIRGSQAQFKEPLSNYFPNEMFEKLVFTKLFPPPPPKKKSPHPLFQRNP